ncbi:hypothetical protein [Saccharibacillus deserti]|uniref:hypothetical protein n=1 Tax=Saccharibacillus deserti TaxID=1634444 RepID=UPI001557FE8C|nr:hypothetical protein [Saccharibacillus deserti]
MKKKQDNREILYVSGSEIDQHCFYSYGIEFFEFMSCVEPRPANLILLKHKFEDGKRNPNCGFDYVISSEIDELIEDDVYGYGDFCWVDVEQEEDLDRLTEPQIAELLFFGHLAKPLNEIPKARFAYYAHDDGWFNKLYVTYLEDYERMLSAVLVFKLREWTRRSIRAIPRHISRVLLEATQEGLFIDLSKIQKGKDEIRIPFTAVGHYRDMDSVYGLKDEITDYPIRLVYSKQSWKLIRES